jgi:hypothetical protein
MQKLGSISNSLSRLIDQCLSQRMMTSDEKLISGVQSFQKFYRWDAVELSIHTTIALLTRQDQVPHAINR